MSDITDCGIDVDVLGRKIRAMNIQVTDYPAVIDGVYYPLYFEIPWANGRLWVVEKGEGPIKITVFKEAKALEQPHLRLEVNDWQLFLDFYNLSIINMVGD